MNLSQLGSGETLAVLIVGAALLAAVSISIICGVSGIVAGVLQHRSDASLKSEMVARGMSADDILRVIGDRGHKGRPVLLDSNAYYGGSGLPLASEAVVERGGEWNSALVLQAAEGAFFVHYVGEDMSQNEWVDPDRIRFPAGSPHTGGASHWNSSRNGVPVKGPMEQEV